MRLLRSLPWAFLVSTATMVVSQVSSTDSDAPVTSTAIGDGPASTRRSYQSYISTRTVGIIDSSLNGSMSASTSSMGVANATSSTTFESTTSDSVTLLVGSRRPTPTLNGTVLSNITASQTSSTAQATNTTPCNGHPAYCSRKFSNITYITAHNSPFSRPGNAASNQELDVVYQLEDGVRMLQFQTHWNEAEQTIYLCHSSCDVLNVGTLESYLTTVTSWLQRHPYDIITILMGNSDIIAPDKYIEPVTSSGLIEYVYQPPKIPMGIEDWPTLQQMIFANTRAVVMLDYEANQQEIPWLLDEFAQMFETPFSPTDRDFPCVAERPPADWPGALPRENRMYMANHNLNVEIALAGISLLVPNTLLLNETNAATDTYGSLKRSSLNCTSMWNRPPNFLAVDYYNIGNFNGSVFQVAADANNVPYDRTSCCGTLAKSGALGGRIAGLAAASWAISSVATVALLI